MKILHVLTSFEPAWAVGGSITAHANLCSALVDLGHRVTVYASNADGLGGQLPVPIKQPVDLRGIKVWYFPYELGKRRAFCSRSLLNKLSQTIRDFDIVHLAGLWQLLCYRASSIAASKGIPYIITPHSSLMTASFYEVGSRLSKVIYWNLFGKKIIARASAVHFLSQKEREDSKQFCGSVPSFIVPNGVFTRRLTHNPKTRSELRRKLGLPENALVLLFLGRVHPKKQIDLVIRALPAVLTHRKDVFFLIVGPLDPIDYMQSLRNMIKDLKLESHVIWAGFVANEETPAYYSAADLLVLPSLVEGVSMSLTEAMAASLPVLISNRVANWVEIEEDGAGLVINPSLKEVEQALLKICLSPELLLTLSRQARLAAENRYDIRITAGLMAKAYEDVITGKRSPELSWR